MKLQKTNDQENISKAVILKTGNKNKNVLKFLIKKIQAEKIKQVEMQKMIKVP